MTAKVIKLRPSLAKMPPGKRPVYRWQVDSRFRPEDGDEAWEAVWVDA